MAIEMSENLYEMGKIALDLRDLDLALENISRAIIEENTEDPEYWSLLAETLFYQAQFDESLDCWKVAASLNPFNKIAWIRISALYALMEQDERAEYYYKIAEQMPFEN